MAISISRKHDELVFPTLRGAARNRTLQEGPKCEPIYEGQVGNVRGICCVVPSLLQQCTVSCPMRRFCEKSLAALVTSQASVNGIVGGREGGGLLQSETARTSGQTYLLFQELICGEETSAHSEGSIQSLLACNTDGQSYLSLTRRIPHCEERSGATHSRFDS